MAATAEEANPLTCGLCLKGYSSPRVLPCLHIYCLTCLQRILDDCGSKDTIACPQCRSQHTVPSLGVRGFVEDTTLVSLLQSEGSEEDSSKMVCEFCTSRDPAVVYCKQCLQPICRRCKDFHTQVKKYLTHKLVAVEEAALSVSSSSVCLHHSEHEIELFCKTCNLVVCLRCVPTTHNGHDLEYLDEKVWKRVISVIKGAMTTVRDDQRRSEYNLAFIENIAGHVSQQQADLEAQVCASYDDHIKTIKAHKEKALEDVSRIVAQDSETVCSIKNKVEMEIVHQKNCMEFIDRIRQQLEKGLTRPETLIQQLLFMLSERNMSTSISEAVDIAKSSIKVVTTSSVHVSSKVSKMDDGYIGVKGWIDKRELKFWEATDILVTLESIVPKVARQNWKAEIHLAQNGVLVQQGIYRKPISDDNVVVMSDALIKVTIPKLGCGNYCLVLICENINLCFKDLEFNLLVV